MNLRKLALILMAALFALQAWAMGVDELREAYFNTEEVEDFIPIVSNFIDENENLDDVEYAIYLWKNWDSDSLDEYLQSRAGFPNPKFRYLSALQEDSDYENLERARDLIQTHQGYVGGYRALLLTYCRDFEAYILEDTESPAHKMLMDDLPFLEFYATRFPHDSYAKLAGTYLGVWSNDQESALAYYMDSVENESEWLNEFNLDDIFVRNQYMPLLEAQLDILLENDADPEIKYQIAMIAGDVADYHFDDKQDYQGVIDRFGKDPQYWENLYVNYCLAVSYLKLDRPQEAAPILRAQGNKEAAREFQEAWLAFNTEEAVEAYNRVLGSDRNDPLNAVLLARTETDDLKKLEAAATLVRKLPKEEDGYSMAAEILLTYFSSTNMSDPDRPKMNKTLKNNAKILRNYYLRFPENFLATAGYFLVNAALKDDNKAFKAYTELVEQGLGPMLSDDMAKFALEQGRRDLLKRVKEHEFRTLEDIESMSEAEINDEVLKACSIALYQSELNDEFLEEVAKHPHWKQDETIQYYVFSTHLQNENYTEVIAMLRIMIDSGSIGYDELQYLDRPELTNHPDWQDLLDHAEALSESFEN